VGQVSEIFDGDAPHEPRGCPAQAWSVAEPLRAMIEDLEISIQTKARTRAVSSTTTAKARTRRR
jgi:glycogen debranching enzyme